MITLITGSVIRGLGVETDTTVAQGPDPMIVNDTGGMTRVIEDIDRIPVREGGESLEKGLM